MLWQEDNEIDQFIVPDSVQDISFRLHCRNLPSEIPVDHSEALRLEIMKALPWIEQDPIAGIHTVYGAATGNGWIRPDGESFVSLSARTRLSLRLPRARLDDAKSLEGQTLIIGEQVLEIGPSRNKLLVASTTIFCRSLAGDQTNDESRFTAEIVDQLSDHGIRAKKMLCGRQHLITTANGAIHARSVMLADLDLEDAIRIQQSGLGPHRLNGCGIFIPHKSIAAVGSSHDTN